MFEDWLLTVRRNHPESKGALSICVMEMENEDSALLCVKVTIHRIPAYKRACQCGFVLNSKSSPNRGTDVAAVPDSSQKTFKILMTRPADVMTYGTIEYGLANTTNSSRRFHDRYRMPKSLMSRSYYYMVLIFAPIEIRRPWLLLLVTRAKAVVIELIQTVQDSALYYGSLEVNRLSCSCL